MKKNKYLMLLLMAALATGCGKKDTQVNETITQIDDTMQSQEASSQEADETNADENSQDEVETVSTGNEEDLQALSSAEENSDTSDSAAVTDTQSEPANAAEQPATQEEEQVEQVSLDGLSTETKGWGSGGNVDENNVPVGCTMYQKQYGHLGADFVRTDSDSVFLTVDEGYEYPEANSPTGNTAKILDTLKEKKVKAVFFITLPYARSNPDLVRRMIDEGHIVGNHSVTHPANGLPSLATVADQQNEVTGVHDYVLENYNYKMNLFRYPTGAFSEQSLAILNNLGYKSIFWSFAYKDWLTDAQPDKTEALKNMKEKLHPGAIYLLHGVSTTNTEVLGDFIDAVRAAGYDFEKYE
jgi:delta-lactam-biosynthetic de-N-acetylase